MSTPSRPLLVVQHEDICPPALVGGWLEEAGLVLDVRRAGAGEPLPDDLGGHCGLLVLGGTMGADDDASAPWLAPVKELVREAARDGVPALGICLGHQLAASALGGRVTRNPRGRQLGLIETGWTAAAADDAVVGPAALASTSTPTRALHWNDDVVVEPPEGTVVLARTPDGEVQAARYAPTVWGLQPHPEADGAIAAGWAALDDDPAGSRPAVEAVTAARGELDAAWAPVARAFARRVVAGTPGQESS